MFRKVRQWIADKELATMGTEIETMQDKVEHQMKVLDSLTTRYERLSNRLGMQIARAKRRGEGLVSEDEALMEQMREAALRERGRQDDDFDDGLPPRMHEWGLPPAR